MTNETQHHDLPATTPSTALRVLERIEAESIKPAPRLRFVILEVIIWIVWGLTLLIGALALAVSGYVTMSAQYAFYEATHENFVTFFVSVMPIIWVLLFAIMTYIAVYEIKKTKRGYRYRTSLVLGSNLFGTVLGALLLHFLGIGYALDHQLGQEIGMYRSMDKMEQRMWQNPREGRLIGVLEPISLFDENNVPSVLNFKDNAGVLWRFNVEELSERELKLLLSNFSVRVVGTTTGEFSFHACGIFPWQQGRALPQSEMRAGRKDFDEIMQDKMERIEDWAREIHDDGPKITPKDSLCAQLPIMKRVR